jgi:type VI secretion system protein ImpJ
MAARAVHWYEGMFLRPHHFLAAQRHTSHLANLNEKWDQHYNWGLRSIELDRNALSNYRFVVRSLEARLRDGSLVSVPDDGVLPPLDLKDAFEPGKDLMVYLGLPVLKPGRANVANGGTTEGVRYVLDTLQMEDENTGVNPQPLKVRLLNLKLLLSNQDLSGYEVIPIARVKRSARAEGTPEVDQTYFPPVLACDAWAPLGVGILQEIFDRVGTRVTKIAALVTSRNISVESQALGDARIIARLRVMNEAYALLSVLAFAEGIHPLRAYLELCRLVGQLSIFGATRRPPELARYDHDDLGGCFYRVKKYFDELIEGDEPEYKELPFVGTGLRMQVSLEPSWLEPAWEMYIGVHSQLDSEECIRLLTPGQLDMKVGSSNRVDTIFRLGLAGLRFTHSPRPPRALPSIPGLVYFQINREAQESEWNHVEKELTLAIRLNEHLIAGNISGQRILSIRTGGQTTTVEFRLYVVPQSGAGAGEPPESS